MIDNIIIRKLPPVWFIRSLNTFRSALLWLNRKMFPANVVLYEQFQYLWLIPCLKVAAELDIARYLSEGSKTIEQLAILTKSHPGNLFRLMRALAGQGIFRQMKNGSFTNNSMSKALMDGRDSLRYMILHHAGEVNWNTLGRLSYAVKTGQDSFSHIYGKRIYEYLREDKHESDLFDQSMTALSALAVEPILSVYDFSAFSNVIDIGGGEGLLLSSILYKHQNLRGILFDLAEGLKQAPEITKRYGVTERVKIIPGNFFEKGLPGADVYIMKNILHNWSDTECISILSNIRQSMPDKGKILIVEMIIPENNRFSYGKLIDIQMMISMREGLERTRKEYEQLFIGSGMALNKIIPTIAPFSIMEVVKS